MKKIMICLATVLLSCSIIIALYPTICRYLAQIDSNKSANNFDESIENIQNGSYEEALKNGMIDKSGHLKNADFELPVLFKEDLNRLYIDSLKNLLIFATPLLTYLHMAYTMGCTAI